MLNFELNISIIFIYSINIYYNVFIILITNKKITALNTDCILLLVTHFPLLLAPPLTKMAIHGPRR